MSAGAELLERVHHVGVAVRSIADSRHLYAVTLGMQAGLHRLMPERGVEVQFYELPGTKIELLAPLGENSTITRFLADRGPGLHHVCYEVADVHAALASLVDRGLQAIDREPREGAEGKPVAFLHPRTAGGVLIEIQAK